jgi:hypothetical protein
VPDHYGRNVLRRVAIAGLLLVVACSDDESVFNAEVGECIERMSDLSGNISELPETDCSEEHEGEVFLLFEHEGDDDDFPGQSALQSEAAEECAGDDFEDYTGVPPSETAIDLSMITPSEQSWGEGDRETICILHLPGFETVDDSFEGNGEDFPRDDGEAPPVTTPRDFSALIADCEGGDMAACDELYRTTPVDSEEERIGATCGGRSPDPIPNQCEATFG